MSPQRIIKVRRVVESVINDGFSTIAIPDKPKSILDKFFASELMGTIVDHEGLDKHEFQNGDVVEITIRRIGNINGLPTKK